MPFAPVIQREKRARSSMSRMSIGAPASI
jgi:hypothetical protein